MTIEQIIKYLPAPICGYTDIGKEKQKEYQAHDSAVIILRKYQKIIEILNDDTYYEEYGNRAEGFIVSAIIEVIKDDDEEG